jgi:hypothetical protein
MISRVSVALDRFSEAPWRVGMGAENRLTADYDEDVLPCDGSGRAQKVPQLLGIHRESARIRCRDSSGMRPAKGDD